MAYYVVKYEGKKYVNPGFAKEILGLSDNQLVQAITRNEIKTRELLSVLLCELPAKKIIDAYCDVVTQDVDKYIASCVPVQGAKSLPLLGKTLLMNLGEHTFARFTDVKYAKKYNSRDKIAHIKVCGSIFVALDCAVKGKEAESIVFSSK